MMVTQERGGPPLPATGQTTITIKEAAAHYQCSEKRIRRLVRAGLLRAEMKQGAYGPQYEIDAATLPPDLPSPAAAQGSEGVRVGAGKVIDGLRDDLREARDQYGRAMVAVGQLQAVETERKALAARAESLEEACATHRSEAQRLAGEYKEERQRGEELLGTVAALRHRLRWRTWAVGIITAGFLLAVLTVLLRG